MCYRCDVCRRVVPAGSPRRTWTVTRIVGTTTSYPNLFPVRTGGRSEIAAEIPVCGSCSGALADGVPLAELRRARHEMLPGREVVTVETERPAPPAQIPAVDPEVPVQIGRKASAGRGLNLPTPDSKGTSEARKRRRKKSDS